MIVSMILIIYLNSNYNSMISYEITDESPPYKGGDSLLLDGSEYLVLNVELDEHYDYNVLIYKVIVSKSKESGSSAV